MVSTSWRDTPTQLSQVLEVRAQKTVYRSEMSESRSPRWMLWLLPLSILALVAAAIVGVWYAAFGNLVVTTRSELNAITGVSSVSFSREDLPQDPENPDPGWWTLHLNGDWDTDRVDEVLRESTAILAEAGQRQENRAALLTITQGRGTISVGSFSRNEENLASLMSVVETAANSSTVVFVVSTLQYPQPEVTLEASAPTEVQSVAAKLESLVKPQAGITQVRIGPELQESCQMGATSMNQYSFDSVSNVTHLVEATGPTLVEVRMSEMGTLLWADYQDANAADVAYGTAVTLGIDLKADRCPT